MFHGGQCLYNAAVLARTDPVFAQIRGQGRDGLIAILALFLAVRFGITEKTIGFFFAYIGVISVITRALVLGWAVDKFGEAKLTRFGSALLAAQRRADVTQRRGLE